MLISASSRKDGLLFFKENVVYPKFIGKEQIIVFYGSAQLQTFSFLRDFCITSWEGLGNPAQAQSGITW